jgi:hypothetical protein
MLRERRLQPLLLLQCRLLLLLPHINTRALCAATG